MNVQSQIAENYQNVLRSIEAACRRADRSPADVTLVAVTKYAELSWVRELISLDMKTLGESRPQQLLERHDLLQADVEWHLIGHLQRNKARRILPLTTLIHSIDSLKLLTTLDRLAEEMSLSPRVLLEVNLTGEASKDGFSQDELTARWQTICDCTHVIVDGLMTMPIHDEDPETARSVFRRLRQLRDELRDRSPESLPLPQLSMGMSGDFEIGIEEGATLVRVGSKLFEGLERPDV